VKDRSSAVRRVALAVGLLYLLSAAAVLLAGASQTLLVYLAVAGLLVLGSVFAWRRPGRQAGRQAGYWQMTGERFRDPATGRTMEIRHNPVTGERDYVEVSES